MATADTVYFNGNIATMDRNFSFVHAMAVKNGWIIDTGENNEMKAYIGPGTRQIDLAGKTVLPGIHDAHMHLCDYSDNMRNTVDCSRGAAPTLEALRDVIAKKIAESPEGAWIRGAGMSDADIKECTEEGRRISRYDLDPVSPNNPVVIIMWDGHTLVANSKALEIAGIGANTPDPKGGEILRDADGIPTGVLQESSALQLLFTNMPRATVDELKQNLIAGQKLMNSMGYTSYTDSTTGPANTTREVGASGENGLRAYESLAEEGLLTARVSIGFYPGKNGIQSYDLIKECLDTFEFPTFKDPLWCDMHMLKLFADGIPGGYSAWLKNDYLDRPGHRARSTFLDENATEQEQIEEIFRCVKLGHDRGWQVACHTIGDKAVEVLTDAFIAAQQENPGLPRRHYLIHAETMGDRSDLYRAARHNIGMSVQSIIADYAYEPSVAQVGPAKSEMLMALRDLMDMGMHIANGSDAIGGPFPIWTAGVQSAVTRRSRISGKVYRPDQRLTVMESLYQFTMGGAYQEFSENVRGSLEPGKLCDFCVLDENIFTIDHDAIETVKCIMTVVNDEVVFEA